MGNGNTIPEEGKLVVTFVALEEGKIGHKFEVVANITTLQLFDLTAALVKQLSQLTKQPIEKIQNDLTMHLTIVNEEIKCQAMESEQC